MSYITVPLQAFEDQFCGAAGFQKTTAYGEVVLVRRHDKTPDLVVKIYTSVPVEGSRARSCGEDSIKIVAGRTFERAWGPAGFQCLYRQRVFRVTSVEGVMDRTTKKAREAYQACNEFLKEQKKPRAPVDPHIKGLTSKTRLIVAGRDR